MKLLCTLLYRIVYYNRTNTPSQYNMCGVQILLIDDWILYRESFYDDVMSIKKVPHIIGFSSFRCSCVRQNWVLLKSFLKKKKKCVFIPQSADRVVPMTRFCVFARKVAVLLGMLLGVLLRKKSRN